MKWLNTIQNMDCLEGMRELPDNSIDTMITDPPYGLKFMGKKWDYDVPSVEIWEECLRVLKPGGTALIFAGSRTQHRMAINVEDAGFILKDCIMWIYGSGFPKATDISKQLDKRPNADLKKFAVALRKRRQELEYTVSQADELITGGTTMYSFLEGRKGNDLYPPSLKYWEKIKEHFGMSEWGGIVENNLIVVGTEEGSYGYQKDGQRWGEDREIKVATTPEAKEWDGWKSHGLKPSYEPILVCMKSNEGTYAQNALKWGVSGLNIDGARIETDELTPRNNKNTKTIYEKGFEGKPKTIEPHIKGRFPANLILSCHCIDDILEDTTDLEEKLEQVVIHEDDCPVKMLDEQSGELSVAGNVRDAQINDYNASSYKAGIGKRNPKYHNDKGGASRFFKQVQTEGKHDTMSPCNSISANNVARLLETILATIGNTAPLSAVDSLDEQFAHNVRSAGIGCNSCVTSIALSLAAMAQGSTASQAIQDSTAGYKSSTLTESLVSIVEKWVSTDTIPTTTSLLKLFGSALLAIDENTKQASQGNDKDPVKATRFLYTAKASRRERGEGNDHPTVKSLKLMEYLCTLTKTPTGGIVLDCFMGSGTTALACKNTGRDFIGFEISPEYCEIANKRLAQEVLF